MSTKFSNDERELVRASAKCVWEEIALDCLQANGGKDMSRSEVIELALDAGRLEEMIKRKREDPLATDDLVRRITECGYDQLVAVVRPAFPHKKYGL